MKRTYNLNPISEGIHNSTLYQPQMTNHFEVNILLRSDLTGDTTNVEGIQKIRKYLNLSTTDFSLPEITTSPVDIPFGNTKIHIAGGTEFGGASSMTCVDYIGADIQRILYNWQMLVTNPETGQQGWAYNYKTDATVLQYAPDGSCINSWVLRGVWPSGINYGSSLSKDGADVSKVEVTLSYDIAYRKFDQANGRGANQAESAALAALTNMSWKSQGSYASENSGGPLGGDTFKDNIE